jgi:peptidyl-prolyl cis-trans isomerase SurA
MTNFCVALALAGLVGASDAYASTGQTEGSGKTDRALAARVNGDPVTRAEVQRLLTDPQERRQLQQQLGTGDAPDDALRRAALRRLINRRLILQEAARRNFVVTEQEVDKAVTALRRRFDDLRTFGAWMKEQGLEEKLLFDTIRAEMLAARVRAALVDGIRITDEQVQQYYDAHADDLRTEEVRLRLIVVKDHAAAEEILASLEKGEDFGAVARTKSIGMRARSGGDTGWVNSETLWPPLRDAVRTMKTGQAGGPLQKGVELLIVKVQARRPGRVKALGEARPEIEQRLLSAKHEAAIQAWLVEQERKSTIQIFPQGK